MSLSPDNIVIEQAATRPDDTFMFTVHLKDTPDVLFAYDKVGLKKSCDGDVYLEYTMSISAKKESKVDQAELDNTGASIIQYLFETTTGEKIK